MSTSAKRKTRPAGRFRGTDSDAVTEKRRWRAEAARNGWHPLTRWLAPRSDTPPAPVPQTSIFWPRCPVRFTDAQIEQMESAVRRASIDSAVDRMAHDAHRSIDAAVSSMMDTYLRINPLATAR